MNHIYFIFTFLLLSISLFAQDSKGDRLRRAGDIDGAIKAYKVQLRQKPNDSPISYKIACAYALKYVEVDSAYRYLDIALKKDSTLWTMADNDLISLIDDQRWNPTVDMLFQRYQAKHGDLEIKEYAMKLLRLIMNDQALDYQMDLVKQYFMKEGKAPHWYYPIAKMKSDYSANSLKEMESLLEKYGWPTYSMVGNLAADAPLLIINHQESEDARIKYLDRIKQACEEGEGSCMEYAKIQDRILVNTDQEQIYGMQFRYNSRRKLEPFPIKDPEYVDKRRFEIGLEPLKDYLKRKIDYDWKIEQKH